MASQFQSPPDLKDLISKTTHWGFEVGPSLWPSSDMGPPPTGTPLSSCTHNNISRRLNGHRACGKKDSSDLFRRNSHSRRLSNSLPSLKDVGCSSVFCNNFNKRSHHSGGMGERDSGGGGGRGIEQLDQTTLEKIWRVYARDSTCHGLRNVVDGRRGRAVRIIWCVLVAFMLVVLAGTVIKLLGTQQAYPTVTRTDVRIQRQPDFPSVTICNKSPFKNVNETRDNPMFLVMAERTILRHYGGLYTNMSDPKIVEFLNTSTEDIMNIYSYKKENLFINASYEGTYLDIHKDFEEVFTPSGTCFTFNGPHSIARRGVRKSNFDGRKSGLSVMIDIQQDSYVPFLELTAGIQLFVSHHPETPRFEKDGLDIPPGTSTRVALNPIQFQFLPEPFASFVSGSCVHIKEGHLLNKVKRSPFYDRNNCRTECEIQHAYNTCGCSTPLLVAEDLPPCTFRQFLYCITPILDQRKADAVNMTCTCPRPCTFTRYDSVLSSSQLPSRPFVEYLREINNLTSASTDDFRENYLEVRVFLDSMLLRRETHEPKYTVLSIFGFLGGQMGFFMGASLMTLVELGETLCYSVLYLVRRLFKMGRMY